VLVVPSHVIFPLANDNPWPLGIAGLIVQVGVCAVPLTLKVAVPEFLFEELIFGFATVSVASRASLTVIVAVAVVVFIPVPEYVPVTV
jgi:hypothetical protein